LRGHALFLQRVRQRIDEFDDADLLVGNDSFGNECPYL
jgi:hypothetical protein